MPLVYVTGISGAGKSAVLRELRRRGHVAFGVDEDGYGTWRDPLTGEERTYPAEDQALDPHAWYASHDWVLDISKIAALKRSVDRDLRLVFLCGVAGGDAQAWDFFDVVCALVIDQATIRSRIELREDTASAPTSLIRFFLERRPRGRVSRVRGRDHRRDQTAARGRGRRSRDGRRLVCRVRLRARNAFLVNRS